MSDAKKTQTALKTQHATKLPKNKKLPNESGGVVQSIAESALFAGIIASAAFAQAFSGGDVRRIPVA
jgi:hypothetical protein